MEIQNPFVRKFAEKEGFPVWDKAKVSFIKKSLSRGEDNENDTIVTVPVVPENASVVKDLLKIKLNGEICFKLIKGENYAQYGFDKDIENSKLNADKLAVEIMAFEKELFGNEIYRIKDNRLFDYWDSEEEKPEEFTWYDDCAKWNSSFENSLGALNSIKIGLVGPIYNSGSVIISDYKSETGPNGFQHHWFTFSTLETPFDSEHPVAGNRRFGIYNTAERPDEWTFYTMGVDRTWDFYFELFEERGFDQGDMLWKSIQQNLVSYINSPTAGGEASFYSRRSYISRPRWEDVKRFLKKEISFSKLKIALGC